MNDLDWSLLRSLAAINTHGSLMAAARASGISQPTLSRHIAHLEEALGTRLIERSVKGATLTDAGAALIPHVTAMAEAAERIAMAQAGQDAALKGTVRITASRIVSTFVLPDILSEIRRAEPGIAIELVASDETENLLRREADIAVRMYRPEQEDVITRKVAELGMGAFAAPSYLDRAPPIRELLDLMHHDVIGYDRSDLILQGMAAMGAQVSRDFFAFRSDDQVVCWQMVRAGFGVGFMLSLIGQADPGVTLVADLSPHFTLPVWLTAHRELRGTPRIRRVFDGLAEGLSAYARAG